MIDFNKITLRLLVGTFMFGLVSCVDKLTPEEPQDDFDKTVMLSNIADNVIVPAYADLSDAVAQLKVDFNTFSSDPTEINLTVIKRSFDLTYKSFQRVSLFEIGPAANVGFSQSLNRFPADTQRIELNLNESNVNLGTAQNLSAKGFPAFEYLLYFYGADIVVNKDAPTSQAQLNYLQLLINDIETLVNDVKTSWEGNYRAAFINANGNDVGSSLGKLTNAFSMALEQIKNVKLGIPLGKLTLNEPRVELVEGKYMEQSAALALAKTEGLFDFYLGKNLDGSNGVGLDDYLLHLSATSNGGELHSQIVAGFELAINQLGDIPDPMANAILENDTPVQNAHTTFQSTLIRLIKVDMSSAFGVQISYVDNDGD
jgi:predicted lipoprotein